MRGKSFGFYREIIRNSGGRCYWFSFSKIKILPENTCAIGNLPFPCFYSNFVTYNLNKVCNFKPGVRILANKDSVKGLLRFSPSTAVLPSSVAKIHIDFLRQLSLELNHFVKTWKIQKDYLCRHQE